MTITLTIELVLAVILVAVITIFSLLGAKGKLKKSIAIIITAVSSSVLISAMLFVALSDQPTFLVNGEKSVTVPVFSEYTEEGAQAFFRDEDLTERISVKGEVNTSVVGEYSVEYEFIHRGRYYHTARKVSVIDSVSPEIILNGENEMTVSSIDFYSEPGYTATDNYDGDLTEQVKTVKLQIDEKTYKITYIVLDLSGNITQVERKIVIKDIVKPRLSSDKGNSIRVKVGDDFIPPTVTATDDLDGNITSKIQMSGSVDTSVIGVYKLEYLAEDKAGNIGSLTVEVSVYVPDDPTHSRIYLTFDDGPSENVTPRILDILKNNNIQATFFINGYSEDKLPLIRRIIDEGHTLAIHGASHDYASIYSSVDACVNNINSLRDTVYNQTGYTCTIMRFAGGSSNNVSKKYCAGVVSNSANILTSQGWRYFDWNVDSGDADGKMSASYIINKVKNQLKLGRANVVLMHDYFTKSTTADALQEIINYGNQNGYVFSRIDENTPDVRHNIAN